MRWSLTLALTLAACLALTPASAQPVRIRGKIEQVDGHVLRILTREGRVITVDLAEGFTASAVYRAALTDIRPNSYVGTAAMPQPDGTLRALEIHIFPEKLRGAGEGSRDFDLEPGSTMTNATVSGTLSGPAGTTMTLTYPGGQKTVVIPPDVPVVTTGDAGVADVKPGIGILIFAADRVSDTRFTASRILIGKDGIDPPM